MTIETTSIVCGHVFREERQVKVVIHHHDGLWQLVCGEHDHPEDCHDFEPVGLEHLFERQPNLNEISDLKQGWMAEHGPDGWMFKAHDD
jgi:hypothetical protein